MEGLVEFIAKSLVNKKDEVSVNSEIQDNITILHVKVAPEDVGKVIGKSGKIAKAIQTVVLAMEDDRVKNIRISIDER